jgi:uncharacterized membrane protein required for colicin V production
MNILGLFGVIDVLIVIAVVAMIMLGWKSGFLLKIVEMASSLFGLIASLLLARPFSSLLDQWFGSDIQTRLETHFSEQSPMLSNTVTEAGLRQALKELSMPEFIINWINIDDATDSIIETIVPFFKTMILLVIAFVSLFIGSMIVFFFLKILSRMVTKIPVVKQIDKVLGALFGLFKVTVVIFILLLLLSFVLAVPGINDLIGDFVNIDMQLDSEPFRLSKWLYDHNIFRFIINVFGAAIF